ncbi:hypothetical protein CFN78_17760 [Amycolatopsis antarctica]|uniref:Uncharacterized protein n=1 Tax=Amycolatopsis antarctica TaxID=1854586 RepID=A0A263D0M8_9PSEU|nr:hypothetical protein [Amycolatopsis antarctica]OZM71982.1 hypothetical protein CFN78_17760 [Amycolatopsis antarctica]
MDKLVSYTNAVSEDMFGELELAVDVRDMSAATPCMATPAAVAAGATLGAAAFGAGFGIGYAYG